MTADERSAAERAIAERALELEELAGARTVAAYVSIGSEPGTRALLEVLRGRGERSEMGVLPQPGGWVGVPPAKRGGVPPPAEGWGKVLLPVLMADNDLDWALYDGPAGLERTARGLYEPSGPRLGVDAVLEADAVLLPGLAVDARGLRLGRGGGSYDRVLARLDAAGVRPPLVVLLYGHEVLDRVPAQAHDRVVDAVVTPDGVRRFRRAAERD